MMVVLASHNPLQQQVVQIKSTTALRRFEMAIRNMLYVGAW